MPLGRLWAGRAYGTNTGNIFLKLEGEDAALVGVLRMNEPGIGIFAYSVSGTFDGARLTLSGEPQVQLEGVIFGRLTATATLSPRGDLEGEWETEIGSAGTFVLFPHGQSADASAVAPTIPDQLHTARHNFGAIEIDYEEIITLAEEIQREFTKGQVVVTVVSGTEQSRFLEDFKNLKISAERAELVKLYVQEPETASSSKIVSVEFGPHVNVAMTQGASEAWVLGRLEKLKRDVRRFERSYMTNFKRFGFGINQILLLAAIVFLPSLATLLDRVILMAGVLGLAFIVNMVHSRYLPFAAIYLRKRPEGLLARMAPSVVSWLIALSAGVAAILLAAYLQGWLLPSTP